jgi:hypothetical protein
MNFHARRSWRPLRFFVFFTIPNSLTVLHFSNAKGAEVSQRARRVSKQILHAALMSARASFLPQIIKMKAHFEGTSEVKATSCKSPARRSFSEGGF